MIISTIEALEAIYDTPPLPPSTVKDIGRLTPDYRRLIAASPFVALATVGPEGLDCSPRGDGPGFVRIVDDRTLVLPDRRGNNRIDSLRNVVRDPRVALMFLIPGSGTAFRVNGRAVISADPELLASFAVEGKAPRTALIVTIEAAYFQCARAIIRAGLWDAARHVDPKSLPTPGQILANITDGEVGGQAYDAEWPGRAAKTMW
jgi:PPOX class probable FMN-dependent enzyme